MTTSDLRPYQVRVRTTGGALTIHGIWSADPDTAARTAVSRTRYAWHVHDVRPINDDGSLGDPCRPPRTGWAQNADA